MNCESRSVSSSQTRPHRHLIRQLERYQQSIYRRPIASHNQDAFNTVQDWLADRSLPLILDSGCGVGASTAQFARQFPQALVIGIDKSAARLDKQGYDLPANAFRIRADLQDFWRLAVAAKWRLWRHYLLYPNPWPKPHHLQRRWHSSPLWPFILQLGGRLELRTNWRIYAEEFALALRFFDQPASIKAFIPIHPLTPFERKYWQSGQTCWRCVSILATNQANRPSQQDEL